MFMELGIVVEPPEGRAWKDQIFAASGTNRLE
jgi:hypothetical protein